MRPLEAIELWVCRESVGTHLFKVEPVPNKQLWEKGITDLVHAVTSRTPDTGRMGISIGWRRLEIESSQHNAITQHKQTYLHKPQNPLTAFLLTHHTWGGNTIPVWNKHFVHPSLRHFFLKIERGDWLATPKTMETSPLESINKEQRSWPHAPTSMLVYKV